ncbi:MAG: C25 family cysteine peptidase, partial [Caldilineaceae bacterium]
GLPGAMVGYDAAGNVICQVTNTPVPEKFDEFIGMYDPAGRIAIVTLNYGASILSESIDDLYFAPGHSGAFAEPTGPLFGAGEDGKESPGVRVDIAKSDNKSFEATFTLPQPQLLPVNGPDQREYLQFLMPGIDPNSSATPGLPDVPVYHAMLAAPQGAKLIIAVAEPTVGEPTQGLLLPAQPSPADQAPDADPKPEEIGIIEQDLADLPFARSDEAYRSQGPFPAQPVSVSFMGAVRDLDLWQISIAGGAYNPAKGEILPYKSMKVAFSFEGGADGFLPGGREENNFDGNGNPLHEGDGGGAVNPLYAGVLNRLALREYIYQGPIIVNPVCWGSEFLIVTDPAFKPAADALRAWKNIKGISTSVVETGAGAGKAGTTAAAIRTFIKNRYDNCLVRPSYLLLLGDAEFIPPFYRSTHYGDLAGTDLDYSLMTAGDILPDLAYGRIPVDTLDSANTVVNKIIAYEDTPPVAPAFYDNVTVASYFQCCRPDVASDGTDSRSFVETSEMIRNHLLGRGYGVQRIYDTNTHYHDDPTKTSFYDESTRSTVPNRYYNGALLPAALRAGSGFAWNGSSTDVVNAFNAGRFLIIHRDHGGINGWGDPGFGTGNLGSLTNGALTPVVYSINCASGLWDNETRNPANDYYTYNTNTGGAYWAEALLRQNGGAVGVIGDTRNSPTWANSALARGLIDATWHNMLPGYGSSTTQRRLGDILNHGKLYMLSQVGVAQTAGSVSLNEANTNNTLYHVIGDPTLTMWTYDPYQILLPPWVVVSSFTPKIWKLRYPVEGAVITALQGETPIARGRVVNGLAELVLLGDGSVFNPKAPLEMSAQLPDGQSTPLSLRMSVGAFDPGQGGKVEDDGLRFDLPAGAFDEPLTLVYQREISPTAPLPGGDKGIEFIELNAFDVEGGEVDEFGKPWTLEFQYNEGDLDGKPEDGLQCRYFDEATG